MMTKSGQQPPPGLLFYTTEKTLEGRKKQNITWAHRTVQNFKKKFIFSCGTSNSYQKYLMPYSWVYCSAEKYYSDIPSTYLKKQSNFFKMLKLWTELITKIFSILIRLITSGQGFWTWHGKHFKRLFHKWSLICWLLERISLIQLGYNQLLDIPLITNRSAPYQSTNLSIISIGFYKRNMSTI